MWLWILSALVVAFAWGGWYLLRPTVVGGPELIPIWVPLAVTAAVALLIVGIILYRRIRAARAARALEKAIAQQAQEQALQAKPERAAEIQELHKQFLQGISALKASALAGGKRGADALYALPWYVMVGPPGAGKTTALRHSGLVFPYLDPNGGGVRGVGGTRNCDWWFTNEAILLDTAGRYTSESDDHEEWMAFLGELLKFRSEKPINGVIIAVSVAELIEGTEDQIQQTAKTVRARIDEMQSVLKMILPVYVVFTKVDLVAGFAEFFGDMKKSERGQAWGSTFKLDTDKREPGKLFDGEFDLLIEHLHTHGLKRMALERSREAKEKVYQFPLEFAAIKRNLSDFLAATFAPSVVAAALDKKDKKKAKKGDLVAAGAPPILRGFYFTSGVQEGRPLDRVVGAMARGFGLRAAVDEAPAVVESKSFFLKNVFEGVIFPDQTLAGRTAAEMSRVRAQRVLVAAVALLVAILFLIPSVISFLKNRELVATTDRVSKEAATVDWRNGADPAVNKVDKLDAIREHAEHLDQLVRDPPVDHTFLMFQADKLFEPTKEQYVSSLREGFVKPTREALEKRLHDAHGDHYVEDFDTLKTYLLLGDDKAFRAHLEDQDVAPWEVEHLTRAWADVLKQKGDPGLADAELRAKLEPHVKYYVDLLRRLQTKGEDLDKPLYEQVREDLRRVGPHQVYYDRFVTSLISKKIDPNGELRRDNLLFPPITLADIFPDRSDVLDKVHSYQKQHSGKWFEIRGPFTFRGHTEVVASLEGDSGVIEREKWVVPLAGEETLLGPRIKRELERVRQDYENEYIQEWVNFFKDVEVESPNTNREAIIEYKALATPEWPYQRLLRVLADNTQFDEADDDSPEAGVLADGGVVDQIKLRIQRRAESRTRIRLGSVFNPTAQNGGGPPQDPIIAKFKSMVRFGVPTPAPKPKEGEQQQPPAATALNGYVGKLQDLQGEMSNVESGPPNANTKAATDKFEDAVKATEGMLLKMDDTGQLLMTDLLMNPLRQGYRAVVRHAGGAASGLWEVMVYPTYRDKIKDRYPFNLASTRDASFDDAVAFYKPKDGILWGFYEQYLKTYHIKQNHDFIPESHLEASPRPAKPYTPFNANMYNCLKRADEITDALWPGGAGDKPKVDFQINVKTVSPIVSEVIFEIDGQKRLYRNEKEFWLPFTWPGPKPSGASIRVRGAGGLDESMVREGPWGIFRLFESGTATAVKDSDDVFLVTWEMTAPPVSVTVEVRPTRANHPFPSSFFRATNCPPSIGDKFGKGKG